MNVRNYFINCEHWNKYWEKQGLIAGAGCSGEREDVHNDNPIYGKGSWQDDSGFLYSKKRKKDSIGTCL